MQKDLDLFCCITMSGFGWRNWGKPWKTSVRIDSLWAEIWTRDLQGAQSAGLLASAKTLEIRRYAARPCVVEESCVCKKHEHRPVQTTIKKNLSLTEEKGSWTLPAVIRLSLATSVIIKHQKTSKKCQLHPRNTYFWDGIWILVRHWN
jgi:hypothetical protein